MLLFTVITYLATRTGYDILMAASFIGQHGVFDAAQETWTQYSERVAYFF